MNGIRLQRTDRGPSSYPSEPLSAAQAAERLADFHRRGVRGIEARKMDGRPLSAGEKVHLLRLTVDLLTEGAHQ